METTAPGVWTTGSFADFEIDVPFGVAASDGPRRGLLRAVGTTVLAVTGEAGLWCGVFLGLVLLIPLLAALLFFFRFIIAGAMAATVLGVLIHAPFRAAVNLLAPPEHF